MTPLQCTQQQISKAAKILNEPVRGLPRNPKTGKPTTKPDVMRRRHHADSLVRAGYPTMTAVIAEVKKVDPAGTGMSTKQLGRLWRVYHPRTRQPAQGTFSGVQQPGRPRQPAKRSFVEALIRGDPTISNAAVKQQVRAQLNDTVGDSVITDTRRRLGVTGGQKQQTTPAAALPRATAPRVAVTTFPAPRPTAPSPGSFEPYEALLTKIEPYSPEVREALMRKALGLGESVPAAGK